MEIKDINEIVPTKSYNLGSKKGNRVLKRSIKDLGCTRSIVVDRFNNVIIGDKVLKEAIEAGIKKVKIVDTIGDVLVVVRRTDIDKSTRKANEIALVDNLTSELNLNYDTDYILEKMNEVWGFDPRDWEGHSCLVQELSVEDCIKEGLAAVDRKDQSKQEKQPEGNTNITQLSLF